MKELSCGRKAYITFFAIVIVFSAMIETLICMGGSELLYLALMWIPAIAATAANCINFREKQEAFSIKKLFARGGFHKCKMRYVWMGLVIPLIYLLIPYLIFWNIFPESFYFQGKSTILILINITIPLVLGIFISLLSALGEEIGWRGFMVPALYERFGLNKMLVISSVFWCCWHLPLLIGGDYMSGTPLWYKLCAFILCIFPVGVMAGLLTIQSGSVWPAAFLHAAHNNYDQAVFGALTNAENKMYYVSETGVLTIICAWILAAVMYLRFRKHEKAENRYDA